LEDELIPPPRPSTVEQTKDIISEDFNSSDDASVENINVSDLRRSDVLDSDDSTNSKTSSEKKQNHSTTKDLRRTLGFSVLFLITINAIFGSSLTYLPGLGMQMSGPSSILMWVVVFLIGLYIALCLSELVSLFPKEGNIYKFAKSAFGHFTGFLVGWVSWFTGNMVASLSIVWSLEYLFPVAGTIPYVAKLAVAIFLVLLFNFIVFYGMNLSTVVLVGFSLITLFFLVLQILPLFINVQNLLTHGILSSPFDINRFQPFFIHQGFSTNMLFLFGTLFLISEAFMGLSGVTYLSQDTKEPHKNLPKAMTRAVLFVGGLSIIYVFGSIGVFPIDKYIS